MSGTITLFDSFSPYYVHHTVNHHACFTYNQVFKQMRSSFNMSPCSASTSQLHLATFSLIQVDCVSAHLLYGIRTKNTSFHSSFIYTAVI